MAIETERFESAKHTSLAIETLADQQAVCLEQAVCLDQAGPWAAEVQHWATLRLRRWRGLARRAAWWVCKTARTARDEDSEMAKCLSWPREVSPEEVREQGAVTKAEKPSASAAGEPSPP